MPSSLEQLTQLLRVADLTGRTSDGRRCCARRSRCSPSRTTDWSRASRRDSATRSGSAARRGGHRRTVCGAVTAVDGDGVTRRRRAAFSDVERVSNRLTSEDSALRPPARTGAGAPSLLQSELDAARRLKLLQDRWTIRRALYRDWQRSAGVQLLRLVKERAALEAIHARRSATRPLVGCATD